MEGNNYFYLKRQDIDQTMSGGVDPPGIRLGVEGWRVSSLPIRKVRI
jgi:hypothetical protein